MSVVGQQHGCAVLVPGCASVIPYSRCASSDAGSHIQAYGLAKVKLATQAPAGGTTQMRKWFFQAPANGAGCEMARLVQQARVARLHLQLLNGQAQKMGRLGCS